MSYLRMTRFCRHLWHRDLIFGPPPNTHTVIESCLKCGKKKTLFAGTWREWVAWGK